MDMGRPEGGVMRPLLGSEEREAAARFLLAQGWAGLHLGDSLVRWEEDPNAPRPPLLGLVGGAGEVRALAFAPPGRLQLLVPLAADREAAMELLERRLAELERVVGLEGQLASRALDDFERFESEITVAACLRPPSRPLPVARRARPGDEVDVHRIYSHVSWMKMDTPGAWEERMAREPTWV
ncbi:MAG: hypothetical protein WBU92_09400, partial [Candidatus Dormiibacterota bacterium]